MDLIPARPPETPTLSIQRNAVAAARTAADLPPTASKPIFPARPSEPSEAIPDLPIQRDTQAGVDAPPESLRSRVISAITRLAGKHYSAAFVSTLPNNAELYDLPVSRGVTARVHVDAETARLARQLPKGHSFTIFGSHALDMLSSKGYVARTGKIDPKSDVDLFLRNPQYDPDRTDAAMAAALQMMLSGKHPNSTVDTILRAYSSNKPSVGPIRMRQYDKYNFGRLKLNFTSLGNGSFQLAWDGAPIAIAKAYADWQLGRIRFASLKPMSFADACQGLLYLTRYEGMAIGASMRRRLRRGLHRFHRIVYPADIEHAENRFQKVLERALNPEEALRLVQGLGPFDAVHSGPAAPNYRYKWSDTPLARQSRQ